MTQDKKKLIITAVIALIIIASGLFYFDYFKKLLTQNQPSQINSVDNNIGGLAPVKSLTKEEVPKDIKIPEPGEKPSEENIAVPITVYQAAPGVSAKFRSFDIVAENNSFNPSTVIAKKGDTVHINFTAADKTYDIVFPDYGMKQTAQKGEKKILEFQAVSEGKFTYYCELCGGLDSEASGYIIITQ